MNEKELALKFYNFLETEKKFPGNSLLKQAPVVTGKNGKLHIDLLILDTKIGEYIGVVEFSDKINPDIKSHTKLKVELYLQALKANEIPFYLIFPVENDEFQILVAEDTDWRPLTKDEFPEFETLSAKKKIQEKESAFEIKELLQQKNEIQSKDRERASFWTLSSAIIGILVTIGVYYLSPNFNDSLLRKEFSENQNTLDSIKIKLQELSKQPKLHRADTLFIRDTTRTFQGLETRLQIIEKAFIDNPKKVLEINNLYKDLEKVDQKIEYQNKLIGLQNENLTTRIEWLNALVIGIILALLAAALGPIVAKMTSKNNR